MSKDLSKKAVEMLLKGATLVSEPCPYCNGVRVMKDGSAFCASCGKKDTNRETHLQQTQQERQQQEQQQRPHEKYMQTKPQENKSFSEVVTATTTETKSRQKDSEQTGVSNTRPDSSYNYYNSSASGQDSVVFLKTTLNNKIVSLCKELESETDYRTQQRILRTLHMLVDLLQKTKFSPMQE